jgi:hypothetical protein
MMDMKSLNNAKARRTDARTVVDEAQIRTAADAADLLVCEGHVAELVERRAGYVASAKPVAVIAVDERLLKARVNVEVAQSKATASARAHAVAAAELRAAEAAVTAIACEIRMSEVVDMAATFERALDEALRLGLSLQTFIGSEINRPLNASLRVMPESVERALSRIPPPDGLHQTVGELRGVFGDTDGWDSRLRELVADDPEPQAEAVAA